jgi:hypothetical protein
MPFILLYSNIYLNFHPTFFSLRAKFRLSRRGECQNKNVMISMIELVSSNHDSTSMGEAAAA